VDLARPYTALCPTLDSGILSVLAGTTRPLTGREVAGLLNRPSHSGVLAALNRLADHGLVDREEAGRAFLFTLNREHLAAPAVEVLAQMRNALLQRLQKAVASWSISPTHLSLFGSGARGEGDTASDIDLFVVRPKGVEGEDPVWQEQLDLLGRQVRRWTGNRAGFAEVSESDLPQLRDDPPPILDELRADAITIAGPEIPALLDAA
jgi:predicted nucleotidyltransferase